MNKIIWINWFQGWDNAPEISCKCLESWKYYNPEWQIILLDESNMDKYCDLKKTLPGLNTNYISLGDLLRLSLLALHGGVWVDSTLWCNKPLDKWLEFDDSFFFTRKDRLMDTWLMGAHSHSYLMRQYYKIAIKWWRYRISETDQFEQKYAWMHMLLNTLIQQDSKVAEIVKNFDHIDVMHDIWNRQNGYGWRGRSGHFFTPYYEYFYKPTTDSFRRRIDSKIDPVYKLTYKEKTEWKNPSKRGIHPGDEKIFLETPRDSQLSYLLNTIELSI